MPILCDFTVVTGASGAFDEEFAIGVGGDPDVEQRSLRLSFNTGGRDADGGAILMFSVKGLTRTHSTPEVSVNDQLIGVIDDYTPMSEPEFPDNANHWYNQVITFDAGILSRNRGAANTLEIASVRTLWPDREGQRENFTVKNIVCFFHQST